MAYAVLRKANLMEDQGREQYIGSRETREEAEELIEDQVKRSQGYFSRSDYYIAEGIA